jgi:hypothetical protein
MSDKYATCAACTLRKKTKKTIPCICKRVVFCSEECRNASHAGCTGQRHEYRASATTEAYLSQVQDGVEMPADDSWGIREMSEKAVAEDPHMFPLLFQHGHLGFEILRSLIDNGEGRGGDMHLLANRCGLRLVDWVVNPTDEWGFSTPPPHLQQYGLFNPPPLPVYTSTLHDMSEHETNQLAFKYYRMAAAGIYQYT